MFDRIIAFCLKYRLLVVCFYILLMSFGMVSVIDMRVDVFPDLNKPNVAILIENEALAPEEMEKIVLIPVENAINGATGITRLSSSGQSGYGIIKAEFDWNTDVFQARQVITERLSQISDMLPKDTKIAMTPIASIMGEIMMIGLVPTSSEISSTELREIAENNIKKRLLSVSGVSAISVLGGDVKEYHINLDMTQMNLLGVSLSTVYDALEKSGINATGGFIEKPYTEYLVRTIGRPQNISDIENIVIAPQTNPDMPAISLKQIADINIGFQANKRGTAGINGKDGILISIAKQPAIDTIELTKHLEDQLLQIEKTLPQTVTLEKDIFKQSRFIQNAVNNITEALTTGAILIAVILFLFLLSFKGIGIVLTVIPATFIMTALVFDFFGISINTMTLGGIAMALGSLIDDAIVGVANSYKKLKENKRKQSPQSVLDVVFVANKEIRSSILFSTFLIFLVFLPLFALSGIEGKIFTPLALAFILSMLLSTIVAVTLTPVLSAYLLPTIKSLGRAKDAFVVRIIKQAHHSALRFCFKHTRLVFGAFVASCIIGIMMFLSFGSEFLPPFNEGSFNISIASAPGTNLQESNRIGQMAEQALLEIDSVASTGRKLGRAELDEHALGVNINEIEVRLKDTHKKSKNEIVEEIREKLNIPGIVINIGQPISHRIDLLISGIQSSLAVKIFGTNANDLDTATAEVEEILKDNLELVDVAADMQIKTPQISIKINPEKAFSYGVQIADATKDIQTALSGTNVFQIMENERLYDVVLKVKNKNQDLDTIKTLPVSTIYGTQVALKLIADINLMKDQNELVRENGLRRRVVSANFKNRDSSQAVLQVEQALLSLNLPAGVFVNIDGQFKTQKEASRNILLLSLLSFALMFGALYIHFKNLNLALQLMLTIPLALVGGVIGVFLTGSVISVATIIGFVALVGIAIRNGILLMEVYRTQEQKQHHKISPSRLIFLTQERLEPVMMTTLTSIIGFIPLIVAGNATGKEILYPLAVVIAFGLMTTTVLNMLFTPIVYYHFHPKKEED